MSAQTSQETNHVNLHKAPTDFPLDFYDADWFNGLQPGQKRLVAKVDQVAFLPDASKSLLPVRHPDEKLGDRAFNSKYYDIISEPYDLDLGEEETMEDDDEESGESLGSRDTRYEDKSDDAEEEDSDYYAEGETGDLYDDAGKPEGVVDMGAKGKGKAKDVSPEPEDKDGSESMED